jgi:outer membrane protein assembly factor BamB
MVDKDRKGAGAGDAGVIFMSYRRDDTEHAAGRLADRIATEFPQTQLFIDVDSIRPGLDFVAAIERAVSQCDVFLALIGPRWSTVVDHEGRRRLDDPEDFVVLELRAALDRDVRVIPILVDGAEMPRATELPPALKQFTRRNGVRLDGETFRQDSRALLEELAETLPAPRRISRRAVLRLAAGGAALALGAGAFGISRLVGSGRGGPVWTVQTGGKVYSSPVLAGGVLFIGSNDEHLYALDAADGHEIWRYRTRGAVTSSPVVDHGVVYVGSNDTKVHAVDASDGRRLWTFPTGEVMHSSPAVADGVVYIGCRDNTLYAIDAATGTERWRFIRGDWFNSSPLVADGQVYIGCRDHNVYAVDVTSGKMRWRYTTESTVDSSPALQGGHAVDRQRRSQGVWPAGEDRRLDMGLPHRRGGGFHPDRG